MFLVVKREKSVDYRVRAKIFEKLLDFGFENPKNAGYLYEGKIPMEIARDLIHKKFTQLFRRFFRSNRKKVWNIR